MRIKNLPSIESMNGSQDALIIEQTDGSEDKSRKVSPAQIKQYVLGNSIDDIYSVMGQMGAKNLIPYPYADGEYKSYRNMTYTVNTDGTITATATQALTGDATFYLYGPTETEELVLKAGVTYVLSGDPTASGVERIVVNGRSAAGGTSETLIINNTGVPKEYTPDVDKVITSIYIRNYAGASMPIPYNETFKPMLRLASDTDETYQPYAKTNRQLTEEIGDLSQTGLTGDSVAAQLGDAGGKIAGLTSGKADIFVSQTTSGTTHSINVGTVATVANRMFLLSSGYPSTYVFGLVFITSTNDIRYIDISHSRVTVSSITYSEGVVTVTISDNTYTRIELIRLC